MTITRRRLLHGAGLLMGAGVVAPPGLGRLLFAADADPATILVVLHLRGGCDGLNLLSPVSDTSFTDARASELRATEEGPEAGHRIPHVDPAAPEFRLHGSAGALAELADGGHLAFVHAAGLADATRSHFVATDMIEHGVADGALLNRATDGWLARLMYGPRTAGQPVRSVSVSGSPSGAWSGDAELMSVTDLANGLGAPGGPQAENVLQRLYADGRSPVAQAGRLTLETMRSIDERLPRDAQQKALPYAPEGAANYEAAFELGRPLKTLAQLIKLDVGLAAATVDLGGWDTHEFQPGRFKNQVLRLSQGLGAFYEDMARYQQRLCVVVLTEFGRRLRSNRSNGTDHGRGSVMLVLGGGVRGGKICGRWPGLRPEQLDEGVDLAVANDYRQVLSEAIARSHTPFPGVFPGFRPGPSLGLFA